jgi:NitT/TauT family transport system substrate-binding protein
MALATGSCAVWSGPGLAAPNLPPVTVALSARNSLYHLPLVLAERLGLFRQQGLQVQLLAHESGAAAQASVLQGRAEVLAGAFEHAFELQRQGLLVQAFVQMGNTPMLSLGVSATRPAPRTWQELKSARIGVSALESGTHWLSNLWLLRNGLQPQDVHFVEVGTSASALGALWEGQVDALCNPDPVMHWLEQRGEIRLIAEARTASGMQQVAMGPLPGGCLMAREDFMARQPQTVLALTDAVLQALRWLQTAGPTDLFKAMPVAAWITDRSVYLSALFKLRDAYARDGLVNDDAVSNAWRVHARVATQVPPSRQLMARSYTNAFVVKARAARSMG